MFQFKNIYVNYLHVSANANCTRDVDSIIFDVHLMQTSLSGRVLNRNCAIFVVGDVGFGNLAWWHSDLTFSSETKSCASCRSIGQNRLITRKKWKTFRITTNMWSTCDLSFLNGEWNDQVEGSQPCHIQTVESHWSVRCLFVWQMNKYHDDGHINSERRVITADVTNTVQDRYASFQTPTNGMGLKESWRWMMGEQQLWSRWGWWHWQTLQERESEKRWGQKHWQVRERRVEEEDAQLAILLNVAQATLVIVKMAGFVSQCWTHGLHREDKSPGTN